MSYFSRGALAWGRMAVLLAVCVLAFAVVLAARVNRAERRAWMILDEALDARARVAYWGTVSLAVPYGGSVQTFDVHISHNPRTGTAYATQDGSVPAARISAIVSGSGTSCYGGDGASLHSLGLSPAAGGPDISLLRRNYRATLDGSERVVGRSSYRITLSSRCPDRPVVWLWVDRDTKLPLREEKQGPTSTYRMEFKRIALGKAPEPRGRSEADQDSTNLTPLSIDDMRNHLGFGPSLPGFAPSGFRLAGTGVYNCPCGCGMQSAVLHYSDGLASYSVFETSSNNKFQCSLCPPVAARENLCQVGTLQGKSLASIRRGNTVITVVGDLTWPEARKVARSVKRGE